MLDDIERILLPVERDRFKAHWSLAWDQVSCPTREGGFGIKRVHEWNKASVLKHIWHILCNDPDSILNRWVQSTFLKYQSFWSVRTSSECSWVPSSPRELRDGSVGNTAFKQR